MTAEDRIHLGLLVALGALAGAVFFERAPSDGAGHESALPTAPPTAPAEIHRADLDRAIVKVKTWVERAQGVARTPLERILALQGLGQAGLDPTRPTRALVSLLSGPSEDPARSSEGEPMAALAILIEGGLGLDQELAFPGGVRSVKQWVDDTLRDASPTSEPSGWELELLSLATLRGLDQYREKLGHLTQAMLTRLDRRTRSQAARAGSGELDAATLSVMAEAWRAEALPRAQAEHELHLSLATFRAVAVLAEPGLERQAVRHLNLLLFRYQTDRALYQHLLDTLRDPVERIGVRVEAVETFGRLGQALYGAHLALRRTELPDSRTATVMRQAARDVMDHYQELEKAAVFELGALTGSEQRPPPVRLLRAAVHALRGLRTARIATST